MFINTIFKTWFLIAHLKIVVINYNKRIKIHKANYFKALILGAKCIDKSCNFDTNTFSKNGRVS